LAPFPRFFVACFAGFRFFGGGEGEDVETELMLEEEEDEYIGVFFRPFLPFGATPFAYKSIQIINFNGNVLNVIG
jgi:hypothetical protein